MADRSNQHRRTIEELRQNYYYGYMKSPNSDELIQALQAAGHAMDEVEQLRAECKELSAALDDCRREALRQERRATEQEEAAYDLGAQSVLRGFLGYPWKDAADACNLLKESIKAKQEGRLLTLPCAPDADAYIIDTDNCNCEACRHGAGAPRSHSERWQWHKMCHCGEYCPLYIRAGRVAGFSVKADGEQGWQAAFPVYFAESATPGEKVTVRVQGITGEVFFSLEAAQARLEQFAKEHDADILPGVRRDE